MKINLNIINNKFMLLKIVLIKLEKKIKENKNKIKILKPKLLIHNLFSNLD